ncbi:class I adenylate-forming enzyme family protein [Nocardioides sp. zg-DK7169]|uniref:class I adenylate-forming enzyme family protein n=1 Tax=Nocardioides sp. zg-DK7169 TaxID=2736600 RepID=UPI0015582FB4|nr:AMP-binding protein [Nocardioides sp. zg-DK7169]NPC95945.1 AMP-binding protein [Nocardioides sp. zg-DK7169]
MSAAAERPWLALYHEGTPAGIVPEHDTMLGAFRATAGRRTDEVAIRYFDAALSFRDLDERSDALAAALVARGFEPGDRLAVYLQNDPALAVAYLAAWKAGGAAVAVNPMNRHAELAYLLEDSGAAALLCLEELYEDVAAQVLSEHDLGVRTVITCSPLEDQSRDDPRVLGARATRRPEGTLDLRSLLAEHAGGAPTVPAPGRDDVAVLTYTSGTTGWPKGAMNTQANLAFNAQTYRDWVDLGTDDVVLGVAPLFHITGMVGHLCVALLTGCPLVLTHRFEPQVVLDAIREHRPTFTVGAITVFIALGGAEGSTREDWSSLRAVYSGGAPIAPAVTDRFEEQTGLYIHNIYGLTETTSPSHAVPLGRRAPVDPASGALSVGVPVFDTVVRILAPDGSEAPVGETGEIATSGPGVVPGYWRRPDATAESLPGGELRTGDVGFMDAEGWFYLVDRLKDMINAAGYKVWPREVEDVLYGHPDVREVAVVGVPDEYRGESVKAFVALRPGARLEADELVAWARERMAAYKYPRSVEFLEELPKTTTGKILRRSLRDTTR